MDEECQLLLDEVREYMTPRDQIVAIAAQDTALTAMATMKDNNVRHLLVVDQVTSDRRLLPCTHQVVGVLSMQDIMNLVHQDERLTLTSLNLKYPSIRNPIDQMQEELKSTANVMASNPQTAKEDIIKTAISVLCLAVTAGFFSQSEWLHSHADVVMISIFVLGYLGIIFEAVFEFNKAGVALLMSTGLWVTYADYYQSSGKASEGVLAQLGDQLAEVSDICFFLLAASAIVEVVDAHQGFKVVTSQIKTTSNSQQPYRHHCHGITFTQTHPQR
jgi:hypothetical protein